MVLKHYSKADKSNYRNGSKATKSVKTNFGNVDLEIPRDSNSEFVPKHSSDLSHIEDKVISTYFKGMSTRDISDHIEKDV